MRVYKLQLHTQQLSGRALDYWIVGTYLLIGRALDYWIVGTYTTYLFIRLSDSLMNPKKKFFFSSSSIKLFTRFVTLGIIYFILKMRGF